MVSSPCAVIPSGSETATPILLEPTSRPRTLGCSSRDDIWEIIGPRVYQDSRTGMSAPHQPLSLQFANLRHFEVYAREALREQHFDLILFAVSRQGKFTDQQVAGALEHLFFAEGKTFGLLEHQQALQD